MIAGLAAVGSLFVVLGAAVFWYAVQVERDLLGSGPMPVVGVVFVVLGAVLFLVGAVSRRMVGPGSGPPSG